MHDSACMQQACCMSHAACMPHACHMHAIWPLLPICRHFAGILQALACINLAGTCMHAGTTYMHTEIKQLKWQTRKYYSNIQISIYKTFNICITDFIITIIGAFENPANLICWKIAINKLEIVQICNKY